MLLDDGNLLFASGSLRGHTPIISVHVWCVCVCVLLGYRFLLDLKGNQEESHFCHPFSWSPSLRLTVWSQHQPEAPRGVPGEGEGLNSHGFEQFGAGGVFLVWATGRYHWGRGFGSCGFGSLAGALAPAMGSWVLGLLKARLETMGSNCLLVFTRKSSFQGFLRRCRILSTHRRSCFLNMKSTQFGRIRLFLAFKSDTCRTVKSDTCRTVTSNTWDSCDGGQDDGYLLTRKWTIGGFGTQEDSSPKTSIWG